jgi:hypothetical protein
MNATVKTAQMGLAAGEVVEVVNRGVRSCVVRSGNREINVTVPTEDLDFSGPIDGPPPEPGETSDIGTTPAPVENAAPYDPETDPAVKDLDDPNNVMRSEKTIEVLPDSCDEELPDTIGGEPTSEVESKRTLLDDERDVDAFPEAHTSADDSDLDEELPEPQGGCTDGESCEACQ